MAPSLGTVGILAGGGPLPARLAHAVRSQGRSVFVVGFEGFADPHLLAPFPCKMMRLAAAGEILAALRQQNCTELVLLGPVKRPSWRDMKPDAEGRRLLMRLGRHIFAGDDGLLAAIVRLLEEEGFRVRGAHEFLTEETQALGTLGRYRPDEQGWRDLAKAAHILSVTACLDIGQGCVVQNGIVLALEALEGTDAMLCRCRDLKQDGPGGVLLKMPKEGQELRADMPAIGPATVQYAQEAGLKGIAFEGGRTLIIHREACIAEADRLGVFLHGMTRDELTSLSQRITEVL